VSAALGLPSRGAPPGANDTVAIAVGGMTLIGWQRVSITRAMEAVPANFTLEVSERYPSAPTIDLKPGDPCTLKIGGDLVLTGFVDRYETSLTPAAHNIRVMGRSKSQDLVDCSAIFGDPEQPVFQKGTSTVLDIVKALAEPYKITVNSLNGAGTDTSQKVDQININLGETAWEIIDRITKWAGVIVYDLPDGSIVLAISGSERMASGVGIGVNVEAAEVSLSMDGRFSDYEARLLSVQTLGTDVGPNTPGIGQRVKDPGVPRFRMRYVVSDQFVMDESVAVKRATWELNRNKGRSMALTCTIDAWRDSAGALWAPNHLAPISAAQLKLPREDWIIASVNYLRDENGQHAALVLMPKEAYLPQPTGPLNPLPPLIQDLERNNPTAPGPLVVGPGTA
jgi:prophage tail gpP-like protein